MALEIQTLAWDRNKHVAKLKMSYWTLPTLDNYTSNDHTGVNIQ